MQGLGTPGGAPASRGVVLNQTIQELWAKGVGVRGFEVESLDEMLGKPSQPSRKP